MKTLEEPKLAAPGSGLPAPERLIAKLMLGFRCKTGSRESFNARFMDERLEIRKRVDFLESHSLAERVLIKRPRGLEDSSRYWSVLMTLDHLRIVNSAFVGIISSLGKGEIPDGEASTATVKPDPRVTSDVIMKYETACDALLEAVATASDLKGNARYPHPWFWPMNAHEWHALAGTHMAIHRVQIERIISGLS